MPEQKNRETNVGLQLQERRRIQRFRRTILFGLFQHELQHMSLSRFFFGRITARRALFYQARFRFQTMNRTL